MTTLYLVPVVTTFRSSPSGELLYVVIIFVGVQKLYNESDGLQDLNLIIIDLNIIAEVQKIEDDKQALVFYFPKKSLNIIIL